jgi:hypothetical protein
VAEGLVPAGLKWFDSGGSSAPPSTMAGSHPRALARSPVAWTEELEAPRGGARGKDEVKKRGFPDAAPTKRAKQIESTENMESNVRYTSIRKVNPVNNYPLNRKIHARGSSACSSARDSLHSHMLCAQ